LSQTFTVDNIGFRILGFALRMDVFAGSALRWSSSACVLNEEEISMGTWLRCTDGISHTGRILTAAAILSVWWTAASAADRVASGAGPSEKMYVVSYPVGDVLLQIQNQRHLDMAGAKDFIRGRVKGPPVQQMDMAQQRREQVGELRWGDEDLVVAANQVGHAQISAMLGAFRKYGVAEYAITVRFVTLSEEQMREAFSDSTSSLLTMNQASSSSPDAGLPAVSEVPPEHHGAAEARAHTIVEEDSPLRLRVLDKDSEAELLKSIASNPRSNAIVAPLVTTFSGQTASVSDLAHSQFIVGSTVLPSGKREPKKRNVTEGTSLHLRPVAAANGEIRLDFAASFSKIEKVTTKKLKIAPDGELTLQIPQVSTLRIDGGVSLKPGQSLLLGSVKGFAEARKVSWTDKLFGGWLLPKQSEVQPLELVLLLRVDSFERLSHTTVRAIEAKPAVANMSAKKMLP
jgi:hypothetical protein